MRSRNAPDAASKERKHPASHLAVTRYARRVAARTKAREQSLRSENQSNPTDYADQQISLELQNLGEDAGHIVVSSVRFAYRLAKKIARHNRNSKNHFTEEYESCPKPQSKPQTSHDSLSHNHRSRVFRRENQTVTNPGNKYARHSLTKKLRTSEKTAKATAKASVNTARATEKTAKAAQITVKQAAHISKVAAKGIVAAGKAAAHAVATAAKAIAAAAESIGAALAAGGWVVLVVVVIILAAALLLASFFGIFASGEQSGTGISMRDAIREIETEYESKIEKIRTSESYDTYEIHGYHAGWPEVLSVYTAKTNGDPENPQEVATVDEEKKGILHGIFWDMHTISYQVKSHMVPEIVEDTDPDGNVIWEEVQVEKKTLHIEITHKSPYDISQRYNFTEEQQEALDELLQDRNKQLWKDMLYGVGRDGERMAAVAASQIGNQGGDKFWKWYVFSRHVEWCACFVSWCANECGHIESGVIPKYAGCVTGSRWFKNRGQWLDGREEPETGMLIFFDWDAPNGTSGPQDGLADHTGIVEKIEDGTIYTIEGNMSNQVMRRQYSIGHYEILGYGVPSY